ncbi:MAG TPA: PH domain-containing protein [Cyclobacteriaceae bacterium]|nr:PH domain-containing protein [Cyclobacteriaceae bacterium]
MEFKVSFDAYAKVVIAIVTILFVGIISFHTVQMIESPNRLARTLAFGFSIIMMVAIYTFCYLYRPLKYVLESGKLIVKRPFKDKTIDLSDIRDAYVITKDSMGWVVKTFGNGGLFGFYGEFRSSRYGHMTWYATRKSNYVMLETTEGRIVLTPDNLEMANEIKRQIQ